MTENDTRLTTGVAGQSERAVPASETPDFDDLTRMARETFGDVEKAGRWLRRPSKALAGSSPLDALAKGPDGARKVVDLLKRIDHGLAV